MKSKCRQRRRLLTTPTVGSRRRNGKQVIERKERQRDGARLCQRKRDRRKGKRRRKGKERIDIHPWGSVQCSDNVHEYNKKSAFLPPLTRPRSITILHTAHVHMNVSGVQEALDYGDQWYILLELW